MSSSVFLKDQHVTDMYKVAGLLAVIIIYK